MRLDSLIAKRKLAKSRNVAGELIKSGQARVNDQIITKPAKNFTDSANLKIEIREQPKYVSRGGLKLEKALHKFKINLPNLTALDVGSSTGGFTDCLLQHGIKKVYAVDVGTNQFDSNLKKDPRIILMEKTDIRDLKILPEKIDLVVIDVSFISLELILETVKNLLQTNGQIIALIKPQFETPRNAKNKKGVVKTAESQEEALRKIKNYCQKINLEVLDLIDSPILGSTGNKEYLILLSPSPKNS